MQPSHAVGPVIQPLATCHPSRQASSAFKPQCTGTQNRQGQLLLEIRRLYTCSLGEGPRELVTVFGNSRRPEVAGCVVSWSQRVSTALSSFPQPASESSSWALCVLDTTREGRLRHCFCLCPVGDAVLASLMIWLRRAVSGGAQTSGAPWLQVSFEEGVQKASPIGMT